MSVTSCDVSWLQYTIKLAPPKKQKALAIQIELSMREQTILEYLFLQFPL